MAEMPDELRKLMEKEEPPADQPSQSVDEQLIDEVAHLLFPVSADESPHTTDERNLFIQRYRRHLSRSAFSGAEDVLLDQLRLLKSQRDETERRIRMLLAYARTVPPGGRKYRLRDLSEATGIPISSIRGRITDDELRALESLALDDERAIRLAEKLSRADDD